MAFMALAGGGFVVIDLPGILAIQAEALYVPKGATDEQIAIDEDQNEQGRFTTTYQINYLEIPFLARVSLGSSPVYVLLGLAPAFKLSSKITAKDVPGEGDIEEDELEDEPEDEDDDEDNRILFELKKEKAAAALLSAEELFSSNDHNGNGNRN